MKFCRNSYFITFWSVVLVSTICIKTTNLTEINGSLPDPYVLSRILNNFIRPMMKSFSLDSTIFRSFKETAVERAVKERIDELQKYLQDNDADIFDTDSYNLFENKNDTTIIEFLPKTKSNTKKRDSFKYNLIQYKKIREKIKKALTEEFVSDKTKTLVLKTINDLVQNLIEGQCNWKRTRLDKTEQPYSIVNKWKEGWRNIKSTISKFLASDPRRNNNIPKYIDNLHMILKKVTKDADLISKKYKIQCEFVPKVSYSSNTENSNSLRNNWDTTDVEQDRCQYVIVCSNELRDFMLNFYKSLNDTTVSVIKNYAEMYTKEVNTNDVEENKIIILSFGNIVNGLEGYISELFIKETIKFKLDKKKNRDANIKIISDYIKNNINNVKEKIRKILRTQLVNIREKIVAVIRDDVQVNLDVDLGNLEQEFVKRICTVFRLCNGRYTGRRQNIVFGSVDKNNVNVEVQLTFDDELTKYRRLQGLESPLNKTNKLIQYVSNVNVTRTTLMFNSTQIEGS